MENIGTIYGQAFEGVKYWLINPIISTVEFIIESALTVAAGIIAFPIFLLMFPFLDVAKSGVFNGPPQRPNPGVERRMMGFESLPAFEVQRAEYEFERIKLKLGWKENNIHIAVVGGTGAGKSTLINSFRGLRDDAPGAAPVGETDCTKTITRYVDPRFPWIVWFDVPGAGTQERPSMTYFEEQHLDFMDLLLVVCASRVTELSMTILRRAQHYEIPAALVRTKADQDLRARAKRECDDDGDEDEIKSKMKRVKPKYVREVKKDLMNEVKKAGLQEFVTSKDCFLISATILREMMRTTKDLPALKDLDESEYQARGAEVKAAAIAHIKKKILSREDRIDEKELLEKVACAGD